MGTMGGGASVGRMEGGASAGRMEGKVVFITGAARGQGRSHAIRLAQEGADIIGIDICAPVPNVLYRASTQDELNETVATVDSLGRRMIATVLDVRDLGSMTQFLSRSVTELGGLDVVVANAAICIPGRWDDVTPQVWGDTIDINLTGAWKTVQASAPHLVAQRSGPIILVSSEAGLDAKPFLSAYVARKFGITGLAKALAQELGEYNVRVNSVHPSAVDTPMSGGNTMQTFLADHPRLAAAFSHALPTGRMDPVNISEAVLYLASDESRYVTAHALAVDGGSL